MNLYKEWWAIGLAVALLAMPAVYRLPVVVIDNVGVDSYETHWPLFGQHSVTQVFINGTTEIRRLQVLIVPMTRQTPVGKVLLELYDEHGIRLVQSALVAANLQDDIFADFPLPAPVRTKRGQLLTLRLQAPETSWGARLGVRYHPDAAVLPAVQTLYDEKPVAGTVAVRLTGSLSLYQALWHALTGRARAPLQEFGATGAAAGLAAGGLLWVRNDQPLRLGWWRVRRLTIAALFLVVVYFGWRLYLVREIRGFSGGDAFNYFLTTKRIVEHGQFYNPNEKRLPFFPLLLVPTLWLTDDILTSARVLNQLVAAATLLVLVPVGRRLKFSADAIWLGLIFTAGSRDFLFLPFRPLPYLLAGGLLLAGWVIMGAGYKTKRLIMTGFILGLSGQTRHEGMLAGGVMVLMAGLYLLWQRRWRKALALALPFTVVLMPYWAANIYYFGSPFYSGYFDHPVTTLDKSSAQLLDNLRLAWSWLNSMWWPTWDHMRAITRGDLTLPVLLVLLVGGVWFTWQRWHKQNGPRLRLIVALTACMVTGVFTSYFILTDPGGMLERASAWLVLASVVGLFLLPWQSTSWNRGWYSLVLLGGFVSLAMLVVWSDVAAKKLQAVLPIMGLAAGLSLAATVRMIFPVARLVRRQAAQWIGCTMVLLPLAWPLTRTVVTLPSMLDLFNHEHVDEQIFYQAHRWLAGQPGRVAMRNIRPSALYFLPERAIEYAEQSQDPSLGELDSRGVSWLIWHSTDRLFSSLRGHQSDFREVRSWQGENEQQAVVTVSVLRRSGL